MVYCMKCNGSTAVYFDLEDLMDALKLEFEDQDFEAMQGINYKISVKEMTEAEIEALPEFDGF